jgi:hypothetical protein
MPCCSAEYHSALMPFFLNVILLNTILFKSEEYFAQVEIGLKLIPIYYSFEKHEYFREPRIPAGAAVPAAPAIPAIPTRNRTHCPLVLNVNEVRVRPCLVSKR